MHNFIRLLLIFIVFQPMQLMAEERKGYDFSGNGMQLLPCFTGTFLRENHSLTRMQLTLDAAQQQALAQQQNWLKGRQQLTSSQRATLSVTAQSTINLADFERLLLAGEDQCGNTLLTSYYSPQLTLKRKPDAEFRFALYSKPAEPALLQLTRQQLEEQPSLLSGLEIGYAANLLDVFTLQIQGSGYVHFIDTNEQVLLGFAAANQHSYTSIGAHLVATGAITAEDISLEAIYQYFSRFPEKLQKTLWLNPRFIFFAEQFITNSPAASNGTQAIANATIAVDPDYIPHGSMVLIELPVLSAERQVIGRELRLFFANDVGSAIKGPGRLDIYAGRDHLAGNLVHYGRAWLLTKPSNDI